MSDADDPDVLAGEYVLGVLDADGMDAAAARGRREADFGARIAWWEDRLAPLAGLVAPVEPPEALWPRLSVSIGGITGAPAGTLPFRRPARAVRVWQGATVAALAMAAAFAAIAFLPRAQEPSTVAALAPLGTPAPAFVVRSLPGGRLQLVSLNVARVPSGRDLQLWALPVGAKQPVSLGLLSATGATIAAGPLTAPGGKLLVSLEPKGGSPTGLPTGAVLYGGTIARL